MLLHSCTFFLNKIREPSFTTKFCNLMSSLFPKSQGWCLSSLTSDFPTVAMTIFYSSWTGWKSFKVVKSCINALRIRQPAYLANPLHLYVPKCMLRSSYQRLLQVPTSDIMTGLKFCWKLRQSGTRYCLQLGTVTVQQPSTLILACTHLFNTYFDSD